MLAFVQHLMREFIECNMGIKQNKLIIFYQSKNMDRFFFVANSFGVSTTNLKMLISLNVACIVIITNL
jgi:hypothetical protein